VIAVAVRWMLGVWSVSQLCLLGAGCGGGSMAGVHLLSSSTVASARASTSTEASPSTSAQVSPSVRTSTAGEVGSRKDRDGDQDSSKGGGRYDRDDYEILHYGHEGNVAEKHAVAAIVKQYYDAIGKGDGTSACRVMDQVLAEGIVEQEGESGPALLRGHTCPVVLAKLVRVNRRELSRDNSSMRITGLRVQGDTGYVFLTFKAFPNRHILLHRESGVWKIDEYIDAGFL
jgi:hypothetical protein